MTSSRVLKKSLSHSTISSGCSSNRSSIFCIRIAGISGSRNQPSSPSRCRALRIRFGISSTRRRNQSSSPSRCRALRFLSCILLKDSIACLCCSANCLWCSANSFKILLRHLWRSASCLCCSANSFGIALRHLWRSANSFGIALRHLWRSANSFGIALRHLWRSANRSKSTA